MAWKLEIHMIDVGQGESCLIYTNDPAMMLPTERTMLIDGGTSVHAQHINDYLANHGIDEVDHIVISHYDGDHSGGILTLLSADNLYRAVETIADAAVAAVVAAAGRGVDNPHQVAAAAAAADAAMSGGYDLNNGLACAQVAVNAGLLAEGLNLPPDNTYAQDADDGAREADTAIANAGHNINPTIFNLGMTKRRQAWRAAAIAAANTVGNAVAKTTATISALFTIMRSGVRPDARFLTQGRFRNTNIIDIGDTAHLPDGYVNLVLNGCVLNNDRAIDAPNLGRTRTSVRRQDLGDELLWHTGPNAMAAPAGSPAVFLMACNKYVWQAPQNSVPIASGQPDNDDSIGLVLRFNRFFYYTAGDLPSEGDELVADGIMNHALPNPQGGTFALPTRLASFKCGHHGSNNSTSQPFLDAVQPKAALISCGTNPFDHPEQNLVNRLHNDAHIDFFYLTNCKLQTNDIPASNAQNQLTAVGNKSRIAGDNAANNLAANRDRGDILLRIDAAASSNGNQNNRRFRVTYYDEDTPVFGGLPGAVRTEFTRF